LRIVCVIDELGSGGAQRQLVGIAVAFKQKGHDVSFLVYHKGDFFKDTLDINGIPITLINESNYLKRLLKMRRFIRRGEYDVVIAFLEAAAFIAEMAGLPSKKWKLIVGERSANPRMLQSFKLKFYRWCHIFSDYIVANSHANLALIKKVNPLLSQKKCKVIYNLLDAEVWKPDDTYVPMRGGKLRFIVASNHQYLKNAAGFIEAVHNLQKHEKSKLQIHWYGDKSSDDSYTNTIRLVQRYDLENVFSFYPATKNIREKMQQADVVGLFSFYEGLPNAVCEAMMLGKVVMASNVSDIPSLLEDSQELIFDPSNINSITTVLQYILTISSEDFIQIGRQNRQRATKIFSKEHVTSAYSSLIN